MQTGNYRICISVPCFYFKIAVIISYNSLCQSLFINMDYSSAEKCRFCTGTGSVTVVIGGDEKEVSRCINCDGAGSLTCTTCQGSGIQPRYLDRRYGFMHICDGLRSC